MHATYQSETQFDRNCDWRRKSYITFRDELFRRVLTFQKGYEVTEGGLKCDLKRFCFFF